MGKAGWSDLHEELIDLIADRVPSNIDVLRIGSICKPWRSTVATKKRFPYRFQRNLPTFKEKKSDLSPTAFFRVTLPSSSRPNKGWLIKTRQFSASIKINLESPFCSELITTSKQTLDLLKLGVSEIRQAYNVQYLTEHKRTRHGEPNHVDYDFFANSARTVLVDKMIFTVDWNKEIWCCKIVEESEKKKEGEESSEWRRIESKEAEYFSDITVQKGLIYALDLKGAIWWISLSELEIFQYRPSTPVIQDYYHIGDYCKDKRLVEYCGDLCVVLRLCKIFHVKRVDIERTVGFKVYKMDRNLVEWVEVSSLGDKAIIMSMESCLMVSASEYYGCLENAIYFTDDDGRNKVKGEDIVKVFKLEDDMIESYSQRFLEMFTPPFL